MRRPSIRGGCLAETLDAIAAAGITILATAADGEVDLDDADALLASPVAWLFGNEAHGLAPRSRPEPITGCASLSTVAESLNLAAAAAICLYASARVQHAN
ncbi:TrmH family RNA methyltransferase [Nocardia sp. NPDC051463]|uniref:TrmH family RNA methyltransferase n=1 Tax=Nocardia sp. NPDC051463 TaxID=3154845 RepID=UPI00344E78F9